MVDALTLSRLAIGGTATVNLGAGDDSVRMYTVSVNGTLTINGNAGSNAVVAVNLQVGGTLVISSVNTVAAKSIFTELTDLIVTVTINNGNGVTSTHLEYDLGQGSTRSEEILNITNGIGADGVSINDTNFGGNVAINNGAGDASGNAGGMELATGFDNGNVRAMIKGSLSISQLTGSGGQDIADTEIRGNVTIANGSGIHHDV